MIITRNCTNLPCIKTITLVCFLYVFVGWGVDQADAGSTETDNQLEMDLSNSLVGKRLTLKRTPNNASTMYLSVEGTEYVCKSKASGIFPNKEDVPNITVTKIGQEIETKVLSTKSVPVHGALTKVDDVVSVSRYWVFTLKHQYLGRGEVRISTSGGTLPDKIKHVRYILGGLFSGGDLPEPARFRARTDSKLLHFIGSGHQSDPDGCKDYDSVADALKDGFSLCGLCFNQRLNLSYLQEELQMGKEAEATARHYSQVLNNTELQRPLEQAGNKVLSHWPTKLKGYAYHFAILDNNEFNAVACPGGFIFVNLGLMKAVESTDELEAILAHEIAHVEQRHGVKELLRNRSEARATAITMAILGSAAGVAAAAANTRVSTDIAVGVTSLAYLMVEISVQIGLKGYAKEHEKEADVYALMYLQNQGKGSKSLISVLKKIRSSKGADYTGDGETSSSDTHASPENRLFIVEHMQCKAASSTIYYDAYNKAGELVYTLSFDGQCLYKQRDGTEHSKLLAQVQTTAAIGKSVSINSVAIEGGQKQAEFKTDGKVEISPLDTIGISFDAIAKEPVFLEGELVPRLGGITIERVTRRAP